MTVKWKIYWAIVSLAVINYLIMVLWSLPMIAQMTEGQIPFDMRPMGYSFQDAHSFVLTISDQGRDFYLRTQQLLDTFYAALLAASLAIPLIHLMPAFWGWPFGALAIFAAIFDYLENYAVANMLQVGPSGLTETMVSTASQYTVAKSLSTSFAVLILCAVLVQKAIKWFKVRGKPE